MKRGIVPVHYNLCGYYLATARAASNAFQTPVTRPIERISPLWRPHVVRRRAFASGAVWRIASRAGIDETNY